MKIAICFFGILGGIEGKNGKGASKPIIEISKKYYNQNIFTEDTDVFMHTWSKDYKTEILNAFSPKSYIIEKQKKFKIPNYVFGIRTQSRKQQKIRKQNHYSRWYSTMKAMDVVREYELKNNIKYDLVLMTRFDIAWEEKINFENIDTNKFYSSNWIRRFWTSSKEPIKDKLWFPMLEEENNKEELYEKTYKEYVGYPHNNDGLLDFWFLSNSDNMYKFSRLYTLIDQYMKPGNCPTDHTGSISNHQLALYHLQKLDLIKNLDFKFENQKEYNSIRRRFFLAKA